MAEREREKTNHQKEAAFGLSEEVEIPGEKHLENIRVKLCREKWKIVGFAIRKEVRHQSLVHYNQGVRGLNLWICMQNMAVIGIIKLVIQFTV